MPSAIPIRLADAVVTEINANVFDFGAITAVRSSGSWEKDFKGLSTTALDVLFRKRGSTMALHTRGNMIHHVEVLAVLRHRFEASDRAASTGEITVAAIDPFDTLLVDIAKLFMSRRADGAGVLSDEPTANLLTESFEPAFANEHYLRKSLYYGFVPLHFSMCESI